MEKEKKKKPESIVLEVQSLRHVVTLKDKKQEAKNGEKHT